MRLGVLEERSSFLVEWVVFGPCDFPDGPFVPFFGEFHQFLHGDGVVVGVLVLGLLPDPYGSRVVAGNFPLCGCMHIC